MKNYFGSKFSLLLVFAALATAWILMSNAEKPNYFGENEEASTLPYYIYPSGATAFVSDTITDAENDTINLGANLVSRWSYNWHINTTQLSGTENIIAIVQETNNASASYATPTDFVEVARDTFTANEDGRITGETVYGIKQRLILDGRGTQSTTYSVKFVGKKY